MVISDLSFMEDVFEAHSVVGGGSDDSNHDDDKDYYYYEHCKRVKKDHDKVWKCYDPYDYSKDNDDDD